MGLSITHLVLILIIVLLLFGARKVPDIMEDLAKGYRAFLDGVRGDKEPNDKPLDIPKSEKQLSQEDGSSALVKDEASHGAEVKTLEKDDDNKKSVTESSKDPS